MTGTAALHAEILSRLDCIKDPCSLAMHDPMSLMEMGLVDRVDIADDGAITVTLCLTDTACVHFNAMRDYIRDALLPLDGVASVDVRQTLDELWTDERIRRD